MKRQAPIRTLSSSGMVHAYSAQALYRRSKTPQSQLFFYKAHFASICPQSPASCRDRLLRSEMLDSSGIRTQYLWRSAFMARNQDDLELEDIAASQNERSPCVMVDSQSSTLLDTFGPCNLVTDDSQSRGVPLSRIAFIRPSMGDLNKILRSVVEGLSALHIRGLAHGALMPENVFVQIAYNGDVSAKLANFGAARSEISAFYAPEIIKAPRTKSPQADMYSFGKLVQFVYQDKMPVSLRQLCASLSSVDPAARPTAHDVLSSMRDHARTLCGVEAASTVDCSYFCDTIDFPAEERAFAPGKCAFQTMAHARPEQQCDSLHGTVEMNNFERNQQQATEFDTHIQIYQDIICRIDNESLRSAVAREFDFLMNAWRHYTVCK